LLAVTAMAHSAVNDVSHHLACKPGESAAPALPIGCEVLDAALGCTANSTITVEMSFEAPPGFEAQVRLADGPAELAASLTLRGNARWEGTQRTAEPTFRVAPGNSSIARFPAASSRVPLLISTIIAPSGTQTAALNPAVTTRVRLVITQLVGSTRVGEASIEDIYHACTAAKSAEDRILQPGYASSRDAVVLIDGRRSSGCVVWPEVVTGSAVVLLGNLLDNGSCTASAAIFSDSYAMSYNASLTNWTLAANNALTMPPAAHVKERVRFWILYDPCVAEQFGPCTTSDAQSVKLWPETNLATAAAIFKGQFGGIDFEFLGKTDLSESDDPDVLEAWVPAGCGDPVAGDSKTPTQRTLDTLHDITGDLPPDQLNVFYVQDPGAAGVWCAENEPDGLGKNTILIGSIHSPKELAHELGHALLNLGSHVNDPGGFTDEAMINSNLMKTGTLGDSLTIGQLFRANVDGLGAINRHGRRTGPTTSCDAPSPGKQCPDLSFDVLPRP
jgi:hypothetical protein